MSRRAERHQLEGPKVSARLKAERIQQPLKAERIQEALVEAGDTIFREAFLVLAPPAVAETLRRFGGYMYDALVETGLGEAPEPPVSARVRAVAQDLRFSAQVLAALGKARDAAGMTPEEVALSIKAESWSREVSELVRAIEAAVGAPGGSP